MVACIPIDFIFTFLNSFQTCILLLNPKLDTNQMSDLADARILYQRYFKPSYFNSPFTRSFHYFILLVAEEYPSECGLLPYQIARHVLENCNYVTLPTTSIPNGTIPEKVKTYFMAHFNHFFFASPPCIFTRSLFNPLLKMTRNTFSLDHNKD